MQKDHTTVMAGMRLQQDTVLMPGGKQDQGPTRQMRLSVEQL